MSLIRDAIKVAREYYDDATYQHAMRVAAYVTNDNLIPDDKKGIEKDNERLENMVRETLAKEFGTKIRDMKSYNLLVDACVHNLKKKQLKSLDIDSVDEL